ncbi:MAG TPA: NusG domain II-containing protein [Ruminococcus sp.]|nr:NusG domain II-containing protein [Ruminococcus sp.]
MTKGVKLAIAAAAVIFLGAIAAIIFLQRPAQGTWVEILQDNKVICTLDLSQEPDRTFRVEFPEGGWNEIRIENGTICISDADCPDHTCVRTGKLRSEDIPIVCLPHKLVIKYCAPPEES